MAASAQPVATISEPLKKPSFARFSRAPCVGHVQISSEPPTLAIVGRTGPIKVISRRCNEYTPAATSTPRPPRTASAKVTSGDRHFTSTQHDYSSRSACTGSRHTARRAGK
jgi:hypothetical protein